MKEMRMTGELQHPSNKMKVVQVALRHAFPKELRRAK